MPPKLSHYRALKGIGYELFIGALSILSICNLIAQLILYRDPNLQTVLTVINAILLPIFLGDFFYRLWTAQSRSDYFFRGFGWADFLSSLPFQNVKILRFFRLWRVARLFMEFGARRLLHEFVAQRAQNTLLTVGFLVLCMLQFGALAILSAERYAPDANITSASDAIWWTYVTITTVGYGDHYPVTNGGRIVGILVMAAGVGLFGTLSGFLANAFLTPPSQTGTEEPVDADASDPKAQLAAIKRMLDEQEKSIARLRAQVEEVDKLL